MEYDRIFSGFTMCKLLCGTRYYGNNFVIAYWYRLSVIFRTLNEEVCTYKKAFSMRAYLQANVGTALGAVDEESAVRTK